MSTKKFILLLLLGSVVGLDDDTLNVKIGRETVVNPRHLNFNVAAGESCKIEVNAYDHMSLRVGHVEPKIFDCRFKLGQVRYIHSGSTLLDEDYINLRVFKFSKARSSVEDVKLRVRIDQDSFDIFHVLKPLRVKRFNGLSNIIDDSVIRFRFDVNSNSTCMVGFSRYSTAWPSSGQMVVGSKRAAVDSMWRNCHEFLQYGLRYQHLVPPTPDVDYLPLKVKLHRPFSGVIVERMYLPIQIDGAFPNIPPKTSFEKAYVMQVDQFTSAVLSPAVLRAQDNETPQGSLVYNVTKSLGRGQGQLVHLADRTQPITSFLQSDLTNQNIAYAPPMIPYPDQTDFQIEFTVFDASFQSSLPTKFHISVRPTHTDAPRIALNAGITVLEGGQFPIRNTDLMIVDDDMSNVYIYVKGGLQHGSLTINERSVTSFRPRDLEIGQVIYKHDDSDTTSDSILLRITDGINTIQTRLHIHIVAKDDTPPFVVNKFDLDIQEGDTVQITDSMLFSHDEDSSDGDISYNITRKPKYGRLVKKTNPESFGVSITSFSQTDIEKGYIHYTQTTPDSLLDSIGFTIEDKQIPPNTSPEYIMMVRIRPPYNAPPRRVRGTENSITTKETDVVYIDKYRLGYEDPDTDPDRIVYTITAQPFFVSSQETVDAGRLINIKNINVVVKDASIPAIVSFSQAEINRMHIAYMPPMDDIGAESRHVRFYYTVSDDTGNILNGLSFQINVTPVNDKPPEFLTNPLSVKEGGSTGITVRQISVLDPDTNSEDISLSLDVRPGRGIIKFDGIPMDIGDEFTLADIGKSRLRYYHDGSDDQATDSFGISVSDGIHRLTEAVLVQVSLIDDQPPKLRTKASRKISVEEGGEFQITPDVLSAVDGDTPADNIRFTIIKTPSKGSILDGDTLVSRFTQNDIEKGRIKYVHNGKEVGPEGQDDSFQFILSDIPLATVDDHEVNHVNITITPVNNHSPEIILGNPLIVLEGGKTVISKDLIAARDVDSLPEDLKFVILKYPDWGYVERTTTTIGGSNRERVNEFWWTDLEDGSITYIQGRHKGVEPVSDTMTLKVTDGKFYSPETLVVITIIPQNDEIPEILLESLNVTQGYDTMIGAELLMVTDMDVPEDVCIISVPILPAHGKLIMLVPVSGRDGMVQVPIHEFTMNDVKKGVRLLYKHYGGEETKDNMMIKVHDGKHATEKEVVIDIISIIDERPEVIKNLGLKLRYGDKSSAISSSRLKAMDRDTEENRIAYIIVNKPAFGKLQKLKQKILTETHKADDGQQSDQGTLQRVPEWVDIDEGMNFTQKDVNENMVRYIHNGEKTDTTTDKFRFKVTDGISTSPKETFEISFEESKLSEIKLLVKNIKVKERNSVKLTEKELSASDGSNEFDRITYLITTQPRYGHIEFSDQPGVPVRNFTQLDVITTRLQYVHTSWTEAVEDRFQFIVSKDHFIQNGTMYILIVPNDRITPTLIKNDIMYAVKNKEAVISAEFLKAEDPDTASQNLTFLIMKLPKYGELLVNGNHVGQEFYQSNIDEGRVVYNNYGEKIGRDEFWFAVTDRKHIGFIVNGTLNLSPVPFYIEVTETEHRPPSLLHNKSPDILDTFPGGRVGYLITSKLLSVLSSSDEPNKLKYLLIESPRNGHLENLRTQQEIGYTFTQADLESDNIVYFIDRNHPSTNDSFIFTVEDSRGNVLSPTTYTISWSVIGFRQAHYVVCEDVRQLVIPLDRIGKTDQQAYVGIRVREMSAKKGKDFEVPSSDQIAFAGGSTKAMYMVDIHDDDEVEKHEKVKLILRNPINTLLGNVTKTTITIINKNTASGACAPVKGLIAAGDMMDFDNLVGERSDTTEALQTTSTGDAEKTNAESTGMVPQSDAAARMVDSSHGSELLRDIASRLPRINPGGEADGGKEANAGGGITSPTILSIDKQTMRKAFNRLEEDKSGRTVRKSWKKGRKNKDRPADKDKRRRKKERKGGRRKKDREQRRRERLEKRRRNRQRRKDRKNKDDTSSSGTDKKRKKKGRRNWRSDNTDQPNAEDETSKPVLVGLPTQPTPERPTSESVLSDKNPVIDKDLRSQLIQQWSALEANSGNSDASNETKQSIGGCNPTTKGFYHKDPATNQVYRCDGYGWVTITDLSLPPNRHNRRRSQEPIITGEDMEAKPSQCPTDWLIFSGRCYKPSDQQATWNEAEAECQRMGGNLPSLWTKQQSVWMLSLVGRKRMWIGLNDKASYHKWTYVNSDPLSYTNWKRDYPRGRRTGNKNCVMISRDLTWSNRPCDSRKARFVCSKLPVSMNRRFDLS